MHQRIKVGTVMVFYGTRIQGEDDESNQNRDFFWRKEIKGEKKRQMQKEKDILRLRSNQFECMPFGCSSKK